MKAIVFEKYGPPEVLQMREVARPTPGERDVLIRVRAVSLNAADWRMMRADPFLARLYSGLFRPRRITTLGADVAGVVEAVGSQISRFKPGDEVFGDVFASDFGGLAEYKCAGEDELILKPQSVSFEEAAALPLAGMTALHALRDAAKVQSGQQVLINGASGGVGTYAIQIARHLGAEVTAVCSGAKQQLARSLGAHNVIDYAKEDFTKSGRLYDAIIGVNGFRSLDEYRRCLTPSGIYAMVGGDGRQLFQALLLGPLYSLASKKKIVTVSSKPNRADLELLSDLLAQGKIRSVIDRRYPLEESAEAMRYLEAGHAAGKVIVTV